MNFRRNIPIGLFHKTNNYFGNSANLIKNLQAFNKKTNVKQTVADKKNLQKFLEAQVKDGKLYSSIDRTSKYDQEFASFLKDYKAKHREHANILDLSHYTRDSVLEGKTPEMR